MTLQPIEGYHSGCTEGISTGSTRGAGGITNTAPCASHNSKSKGKIGRVVLEFLAKGQVRP
jgi:hypothetical protein